MSTSFDTLARLAATARSRRASLLALGGAALAATTAQTSTSGAKKKKKKVNCNKEEQQRCANDTAACLAELEDVCEEEGDEEECIERLTPCCGTCSAAGFLECLADSLEDD